MNELSAQETRTPIEIALEMTEDGMVSSKKLYEFLELAPSQYARWCKDNIIENPLVDENVDYKSIRLNVEWGGQATTDYLLTIEFAKELCMSCRSEKGRLAREYFKRTEKALVITIKEFNDFKQQVLDQYTALQIKQDETVKLIESRLDVLESDSVAALDEGTEWAREIWPRVKALAEAYTRGDTNKCMDRLIERAEDLGMRDSYDELKAYYGAHHDGKRAKKILIMAQFEESREPFERALEEYEREWGLYKQNEGQKYLERMMDGFGIEIVPDPPEHRHEPTNEELADMWADMDKMYGPGWDTPQNYPPEEVLNGNKDSD